jgi:NADPH-dependent 2,4-dienoyl-CoA reductase/sulfur reductase-like enzyme
MTDSDNSPVAVPEDGDASRVGNGPATLVVGAGPTGLLLASELHRRGVSHVI